MKGNMMISVSLKNNQSAEILCPTSFTDSHRDSFTTKPTRTNIPTSWKHATTCLVPRKLHSTALVISLVYEQQSFDSSRSFNMRGIGKDGVRCANTAPGIDLNFNTSSIQEDEEAARYTRYRDSD
ncbi:hypothetical protein PIB30_033749 [Stylosanthes scabra]|uniref:Uncharacterized protein n=1 Tax=Stylosanthes scabra TaxID=79078 RepID=A0ABU6RCS7_9FABA|nr:hypothetical protein [Stylosanthes scabra]